MPMIVAGHQPVYLPWLGYLCKIRAADAFCLIDTIPYQPNTFQNRNKIRAFGDPGEQWLEVPIISANKVQLIKDVQIDNTQAWGANHWCALEENYANASYFERYASFFYETYSHRWQKLADLNEHIILGLLGFLSISTKVVRASTIDVVLGEKNLHVDISEKLGGSIYLSGAGKCLYLDPDALKRSGIEHRVQTFIHPTYSQIHGTFIPNMAAVDLLFNCGPAATQYLV